MVKRAVLLLLLLPFGLFLASACFADAARDAILNRLAAEAKQADPAFTSFSAERGRQFWQAQHAGGRPETPSCTSCHTTDPMAVGETRAGKSIAPMAVSRTPERFTDAAKVAKWFDRNCHTVLGRACTAIEEGDIITYLSAQ